MREMERSDASSSPLAASRRFFLSALLSLPFPFCLFFLFFFIISRFFALGWHRRHVADFLWTARFPEYLTPNPAAVILLTRNIGEREYISGFL